MTSTCRTPSGEEPKALRYKLECGHQRAVTFGHRRLNKRTKASIFVALQDVGLWCYSCGDSVKPARLLGVELAAPSVEEMERREKAIRKGSST